MAIKYTHRTTDGRRARIVCTDRVNVTHLILALVASTVDGSESYVYLTKDLATTVSDSGYWSQPFLVEYSPWEEVAVDTPVWVLAGGKGERGFLPRHFAKYESGFVYTFQEGRTSHTGASDLGCVPHMHAFLEKPSNA